MSKLLIALLALDIGVSLSKIYKEITNALYLFLLLGKIISSFFISILIFR